MSSGRVSQKAFRRQSLLQLRGEKGRVTEERQQRGAEGGATTSVARDRRLEPYALDSGAVTAAAVRASRGGRALALRSSRSREDGAGGKGTVGAAMLAAAAAAVSYRVRQTIRLITVETWRSVRAGAGERGTDGDESAGVATSQVALSDTVTAMYVLCAMGREKDDVVRAGWG